MPRFVILLHETPPGYIRATHYDLMLQHGDALRTWALAELPQPGQIATAERLPDHRLAYLDYEGEISGDRGSVRRVDRGEYTIVEDLPARLVIKLHGDKFAGQMILTAEADHRWRVSLSAD